MLSGSLDSGFPRGFVDAFVRLAFLLLPRSQCTTSFSMPFPFLNALVPAETLSTHFPYTQALSLHFLSTRIRVMIIFPYRQWLKGSIPRLQAAKVMPPLESILTDHQMYSWSPFDLFDR